MVRTFRRLVVWAVILSVLVVAVAGGLLGQFAFAPARPGAREPVVFEVQRGQSPSELSRRLEAAGVVSDARRMKWLGRLTRSWGKVKAGEYQLTAAMTPLEVLKVLMSGVSIPYPITIREGQNMFEIADAIAARKLVARDRFLALARDPAMMAKLGFAAPYPPSLEGYLFPDTYNFDRTTSAEEMIRRMFRNFEKGWGPAEDKRAQELGLTRHQVVILASIVEKESGHPEDRTKVSSVFHNRLRKRMRLQSDPTIIYGMWEQFKGALGRADILRPSPYNTYTVDALPAGPISNPGREAIQATLNPAKTDFLYFVSMNDGTTYFSKSLEEHNAAVRRYQLDPKAREGKSWRDLGRKGGEATR